MTSTRLHERGAVSILLLGNGLISPWPEKVVVRVVYLKTDMIFELLSVICLIILLVSNLFQILLFSFLIDRMF